MTEEVLSLIAQEIEKEDNNFAKGLLCLLYGDVIRVAEATSVELLRKRIEILACEKDEYPPHLEDIIENFSILIHHLKKFARICPEIHVDYSNEDLD